MTEWIWSYFMTCAHEEREDILCGCDLPCHKEGLSGLFLVHEKEDEIILDAVRHEVQIVGNELRVGCEEIE